MERQHEFVIGDGEGHCGVLTSCGLPASAAIHQGQSLQGDEAQPSSSVGDESPRPALETRTFTEVHFRRFGPCHHSMRVADCVGCLWGHAASVEEQLQRLEASIALPIKRRVETIVLEAVTNWFNSWKHVPVDTEGWIKSAAHSLSWDINRALPMFSEPERDAETTTER